MKVNKFTIPSLIEQREEFMDETGTLRSVVEPGAFLIRSILSHSYLDEVESARFQIDAETKGIKYLVLSFETPIAWETRDGIVYKVLQPMSETTTEHQGLLYLFFSPDS